MRALRNGHAARLLVVDDDDTTRLLLVRVLSDAGFPTDGARDGGEALARLRSEDYDLVISDVNMPGMGGLDLLEALHTRSVSVPAILVTGSPDDEVVQTAEALGAFAVMAKPFDLDELVRVVEVALEGGERGAMRLLCQPPHVLPSGAHGWGQGSQAGARNPLTAGAPPK